MSDIIIEGKNLDDITQSNFQTVGPKGSFHFPKYNNYSDMVGFWESTFRSGGEFPQIPLNVHIFGMYGGYENTTSPYKKLFADLSYGNLDEYRLSKGWDNSAVPKVLTQTTVEPWQGRLEFDPIISGSAQFYHGASKSSLGVYDEELRNIIASNPLRNNYQLNSPDGIFFPYFYNGDVYITNYASTAALGSFEKPYIKATYSNRLDYIIGRNIDESGQRPIKYGYGLDISNQRFEKTQDNRFSLGTITENDKQYWELQTIDPKTRESQFGNPKMQVAVSAEIAPQETTPVEIVTSDEEFFSVDTFVYTQRATDEKPDEIKTTPLFFYYDKQLHNERYNLATNGKVFMKIELRESGRNYNNEIDLFQERRPFRPFLLGFEKEEQLQGTGEVDGEGLYNLDQQVMLRSLPSDDSYSSGIYDSDDNLLTTNPEFILNMPDQDIQFLSRFRPNPLIQLVARHVDIDTGELVVYGGEGERTAKGLLKLTPISETGSFQTGSQLGNYVERNTYRPTNFGGEEYLIEQEEVTNNYGFTGFTFVSSSDLITELSLDVIGGEEVESGQTFRLREDFHIPLLNIGQEKADFWNRDPVTPVLRIYANYSTATFRYRNLNNFVDFENNFDDALKYGPVKFYIYRGWDETKLDTDGDLNHDLYGLAEYPEVAYQYQDEVVFPLWDNSDNDPRLTISSFNPGSSVGENGEMIVNGLQLGIPDGYTYGEFYLHQNGEEIPLVEAGAEPIPATFANARDIINNGEAPPDGGTQQRSVGSRFGNNDVFILSDIYVDQQASDEYYTEYVYEWSVDQSVFEGLTDGAVDRYQQDIQLSYNANDAQNHDRQSVRIFGSIDESTNLLDTNEFTTQLLNQPVTHSFSHQPLQLGTYVKCKLDTDIVETTFELTSVGPDEIVRERADSGVIDANMFGFEEEVRFQVTPTEPAEQPLFNVFVWDDEDSTLKNINDGDINLTKEQFGVTFEWNEGGNFGTLNYNVPESRDAAIFDGNRPIWFKYVEFRFSVLPEEDFTNEQSDGQGTNWFVFPEYLNSQNGSISGPSGVVSSIDYENFSDSDAADRTFTVTSEPDPGYMIESWEIINGDATIIGSAFNSSVLIRADGEGVIAIKANFQEGDSGPS